MIHLRIIFFCSMKILQSLTAEKKRVQHWELLEENASHNYYYLVLSTASRYLDVFSALLCCMVLQTLSFLSTWSPVSFRVNVRGVVNWQLQLSCLMLILQQKYWSNLKTPQKIAIMDILFSFIEFASSYNSYSNLRTRMNHIPTERLVNKPLDWVINRYFYRPYTFFSLIGHL